MKSLSKLKSAIIASSLSLTLFACGGSDSATSTAPINVPPAIDYQQLINDAVSEKIPGVVLLVEAPDKKFLGSAGFADVQNQEPMETYHVIPNGSAGKKLTSLLAVMLADEGVLNLDDTLDTWLPESLLSQIVNSEHMTLRQLLNHTSGIYDFLNVDSAAYYQALLQSDPTALKTDSYAIEFGLNKPAYFAPGTGWFYSNTGYALAGLIMDKVLGEHHSIAMRNRILDPLGMNSSHYGGMEKSLGDITSGYFFSEEYGVVNTKEFFENIGLADGPLHSSVEDMALLLESIVTASNIVSPAMRDMMISEENLININLNKYYGLGVFKEIINDKTVYSHEGGEPGYTTINLYIAETKTSITAFFNGTSESETDNTVEVLMRKILKNELSS